MINKIGNFSSVSFSAKKKKLPSDLYYYEYVNNKGLAVDRYLFINKKGYDLTLTDSEGKPKSGLSRVLTLEEAAMVRDINSSRIQTYIDLLDSGLNASDAVNIAKSEPKFRQYNNLTQTDETQSRCKTGFDSSRSCLFRCSGRTYPYSFKIAGFY